MMNILKKIIYYLFLTLAILGFLLIYLSPGGKRYYHNGSGNEYSIYALLIGVIMILPLFVYYLIRGKLFKKNDKEDNLKTYLPLNKIENIILNEKKRKKFSSYISIMILKIKFRKKKLLLSQKNHMFFKSEMTK